MVYDIWLSGSRCRSKGRGKVTAISAQRFRKSGGIFHTAFLYQDNITSIDYTFTLRFRQQQSALP